MRHRAKRVQPSTQIFVVETFGGQVYLGRIARITLGGDEVLKVYNGYRGHPPTLPASEVCELIPAQDHPDVEPETVMVSWDR